MWLEIWMSCLLLLLGKAFLLDRVNICIKKIKNKTRRAKKKKRKPTINNRLESSFCIEMAVISVKPRRREKILQEVKNSSGISNGI